MISLSSKIKHFMYGPEISIFHEFHKPPYGGGNQFLLALTKELRKRGHDVGTNSIGSKTRVCMFNSFNFDFDRLSKLQKKFRPRMVHRLAGPIGVYRGSDLEVDKKTWTLNKDLADQTIFQSQYSCSKYQEIGLPFENYTIIHNSCDGEIFNPIGRISHPNGKRRVRLIATAWSNNPKKGGPLLSWLDEHLDHTRYDLTFVGRTKAEFKMAKALDPVPSEQLAQILREHDIYIAPSQDDPCSNALIEALSCGLPAVYLNSGGHPELVKAGGYAFSDQEDLLSAIDKVAADYESYQLKIEVSSMQETADKYSKVFFG